METLTTTIRLLNERGSVRHYSDKPVTDETLNTILDAGIHAASGGNLQPYSVITIENNVVREKLAELCHQKFIATAPVNLLFCIDYRRNARIAAHGKAPYTAPHSFRHFWISFQDVIIAAQTMCTAADALGLGSCYIGTIMEYIPECRTMFNLPEGVIPVVLLTLGYPVNPPVVRNKLPRELIVHKECYNDAEINELYAAYQTREKNWKMDVTPEYIEEFRTACEEIDGKDFAEMCTRDVEEKGFFNAIQYRFGLHYPAHVMPYGNREKIQQLRECGLFCFERWEGEKDELR